MIIGITGGIGSGKTIVCEIFKQLGVPVFNADFVARDLMLNSEEVYDLLQGHFGKTIFPKLGQFDKVHLSQIVFNNPDELSQLNSIVHPFVKNAFTTWKAKQSAPYILHEAAILIESGFNKLCDKVIVVIAPEDLRIQRVCERDGKSTEEVVAIIQQQMSDEERLKHANYTIINNEISPLLPQVLTIHETLLSNG
ncbi:MAG: dephospho-CoA kinase [Bacteroidota bacterium]